MKKTILMAAVALLASGAAMADNASGVWGGFKATATDGVVHLPSGNGTTTIYGTTNSSDVNTTGNGANVGDSYAGIAGYYTGIAASAVPLGATNLAGYQTANVIGYNPALDNTTTPSERTVSTGINAYGQALNPTSPGSVDLSGQSFSSAESAVQGSNMTAKTSGATGGNVVLVNGAAGSFGGAIGTSDAFSNATNNSTGNSLYTATAGNNSQSASLVNTNGIDVQGFSPFTNAIDAATAGANFYNFSGR
jgi:hypothetical protein